MEEILASIRRIISEDETAPAEGESTEAAAEPEPDPEPEPEPEVASAPEPEPEPIAAPEPDPIEEEALELTQKVESHGDLDFVPAAPAPAPPLVAAQTPVQVAAPTPTLVSEHVAAAAAATFGRLSANLAMPPADQTLDGVVREMLRPMLQQWLDDNLPAIVQRAVEAEVERISRARVR